MPVSEMEKPFNIDGLAARWEVAPGTIYKMIKRGELKAFRAGKSPLRISAQEVLRHEAGQCGGSSSIEDTGMPSVGTMARHKEHHSVPRIVRLPSGH